MIKDFFNDVQFNLLRKRMGIPKGYYAEFDGLEINEFGFKLDPIKVEALKRGGDVDITIDELDFSEKDPVLRVGSVNVVLYMRDQFVPSIGEYKYHISWCNTLKERKQEGRIQRYVITRKNDEYFNVNLFEAKKHKLIEKNHSSKMKVCKNCLNKLNYNGYKNSSYEDKAKIYEDFSLEQFLEQFNKARKSFIPDDVKLHTETTQPINEYPSNWNKISKRYRELKKYKCEKCGKNCESEKHNIHVHHKNGNKFDVRDSNLIALCKKCHEKEHSHLK